MSLDLRDAELGDMSLEISKLSNGLTVVTDPMSQLESAAVGLWVNTGSRNEKPAEMGVSHMLEHMAFKGTTSRSARAIADELRLFDVATGELDRIQHAGGGLHNAGRRVAGPGFKGQPLHNQGPETVEIDEGSIFRSVAESAGSGRAASAHHEARRIHLARPPVRSREVFELAEEGLFPRLRKDAGRAGQRAKGVLSHKLSIRAKHILQNELNKKIAEYVKEFEESRIARLMRYIDAIEGVKKK